MQMPRPTDAHKKLERLVGHWTGNESIAPSPMDPQGGPATGRAHNRAALDGFAVIQDYEQERNGKVSFRGHGVFRFDSMQNDYVMHWFDSFGFPPSDYRGQFHGDILTLIATIPMGQSRATFDLSTPNKYVFKMDVSQDGQTWHPFMQGHYTRKD